MTFILYVALYVSDAGEGGWLGLTFLCRIIGADIVLGRRSYIGAGLNMYRLYSKLLMTSTGRYTNNN